MAVKSELQAVNELLGCTNNFPVSALDALGELGTSIQAQAQRYLRRENTRWQTHSYRGNTTRLTLTAVAGAIALATTVLKVRAIGKSEYRHVDYRNGFLYDLDLNTAVFGATESIDVEVSYEIAFDQLPEEAREAIIDAARRRFQQDFLGSPEKDKMLQEQATISELGVRRPTTFAGNQPFNITPIAVQAQPQAQGQ